MSGRALIHRRALLALIALGSLGLCPATAAQSPARVYRLGILCPTVPEGTDRIVQAGLLARTSRVIE